MTERTTETNMPAAIKTQNDARAGALAELVALARDRRASSIAAFLTSPDAALMAAAACWAACIGSVYGRAWGFGAGAIAAHIAALIRKR